MGEHRKLWWTLIAILAVTFTILGFSGVEIYKKAPPIPEKVVTSAGQVLMTSTDILNGQTAWQSTGGMQIGSIWGHGAYQAPDWSADWLHRELLAWLDLASQELYAKPFKQLDGDTQAALEHKVKTEYRNNTFNEQTGTLIVSERRAKAMAQTADYYQRLYGAAPELQATRDNYAMKEDTLPSAERRADLTKFFFWTSWAAATQRPGTDATYTNNWPPEPLIGNHPTPENVIWSLVCVIILIAGIGFLVLGWAFLRRHEPEPASPATDPILSVGLTPSQRALGKYLVVVVAMFIGQILLGGFTAHYTIEGQHFYGIDVSQWFPYSLTRTWHLQLAIFWIATAFLTAGLFLAPIINGGKDPKFQKLGVNVLFCALIVVVGGALLGNFLAIKQVLPAQLNFWLGHQGYEYLDLGRLWQVALFIGILFWLGLMLRAMLPALRQKGDKNLLALLCTSTIAIGLFYGAGLFYGERTHITIMEYWRWWVVHLWVEGIFEVFATTALAFIFSSMGLVSRRMATASSLAAASLFMVGGVPGTFHHIYFSGTTTPVMAIGAAFSALEVVPLILLGYEAWDHWRLKARAPWMENVKWPLMCFVAVAFWNMVGAGVFGFMINTPVALFYLQGLNTTAVHSHAALFGVYGFLSLGFVLLVLRYIRPGLRFSDSLMRTGFWWLNAGLVLMIATSLLPIGIYQFYASLSQGMWYARSDAFLQQDFLETLRWVRTFGDVVFIVGGAAVAWQVVIGVLGKGASARVGNSAVLAKARR
ncbi:nitric-oxide reductase large subunit [Eoetvoesiella caeni]|uniref:Nitric oxide reductase NorZ apoprotein n=1 Tax=Eoetvoesiella caeni TaxID=645616 RepID=A0A366HKE2_9BURK|nr:nitric-oxide reductase large subunit [Eoetvoesiella caeni]MCI2807253.1 nitric-oxide reductase large subunit [Eoetvoesiella caeni]NYT53351.1 nitric-oxide reductase large subunit [Eoetvoesiella caeni]RBP43334.1 nitric oxide reductase NorZ apoprotein [Eoetvoesiella caeni]